MSDHTVLWILFGLLSVVFVAMQFAFRPKPGVTPGIFVVPAELMESVRLITGTNVAWSFAEDRP